MKIRSLITLYCLIVVPMFSGGCTSVGAEQPTSLRSDDIGSQGIGIELDPGFVLSGPDVPQSDLDNLVANQIVDNSSLVSRIVTPEYLKAYAAASTAIASKSSERSDIGKPEDYLIGFGQSGGDIYISFIARYVRNDIPYNKEYRELFGNNDSYFYGFGNFIPLIVTISKDSYEVVSIDGILM